MPGRQPGDAAASDDQPNHGSHHMPDGRVVVITRALIMK
jgi:hypothetical protein